MTLVWNNTYCMCRLRLRWHKKPNFTATLHEQTYQDSAHIVLILKENNSVQVAIGFKWIPGCKFYVKNVLNQPESSRVVSNYIYRFKFYFHLTMYIYSLQLTAVRSVAAIHVVFSLEVDRLLMNALDLERDSFVFIQMLPIYHART